MQNYQNLEATSEGVALVSWELEEEGMAWVVAVALNRVHSSRAGEGGRTAVERELRDEVCPGFRWRAESFPRTDCPVVVLVSIQ